MTKTLVAGPWLGEFGWELFGWQGYLRALSKKFDRTIIVAKGNTDFLYKDFSDTYLKFVPERKRTTEQYWMSGYEYNLRDLKKCLKENQIEVDEKSTTYLLPRSFAKIDGKNHFGDRAKTGIKEAPTIIPKYIKFESAFKSEPSIVFHCRNRRGGPRAHNWDESQYEKLAQKLINDGYRVVCVGTKEESICVSGSVDKRGCDMTETISLFNNSICVFGTSSGAMHLASLCGARHLVWSLERNRKRYKTNWNPHKSPVKFVSYSEKNPPNYKYIYSTFKDWE